MFHEGGWNGYYLYYHNPRFLPDAQVEMSVDDGEWQAMYADTFSINTAERQGIISRQTNCYEQASKRPFGCVILVFSK